MKSNSRIIGAVLLGVGSWLLAGYFQGAMRRQQKLGAKKNHRHAVQSWEGEGGTIVDRAPARP